ncbi:hypothetical protein FX155_07045 [Acidaminococcus fermentans]|uniref:Uncharacterized protein n=1 Tax=Acidaminococcus fermentans TaxID=905 RepID=A0A6N7VL43_ACIFE|nr:hypothetical protein [Acidaminococcus fermentans]MSS82347.1 hypothetical protein [Acidaminococcus fermentans]
MNDRGRMMLRAQCSYSDYKRLKYNRRLVFLRNYLPRILERKIREAMEAPLQFMQNGVFPNPLEDIVIPVELEIGEKS